MTSVDMGGFVTSKGWLELGTYGSTKMKIEYFNINNAAPSSNKKADEEDKVLMKVFPGPQDPEVSSPVRHTVELLVPSLGELLARERVLQRRSQERRQPSSHIVPIFKFYNQ